MKVIGARHNPGPPISAVWTSVVGLPDVTLETGLMRAYHRHMQDFCGPFPDRLKGPIVILYVFFLDYYVSGLTAGAVKS